LTVGGIETLPQGPKVVGQASQFLHVLRGQPTQSGAALPGERQAHHPTVVGIVAAFDESGSFCPLCQFDRAVMAQQQVSGDVADCRSLRLTVPANGQEQLVLGRGEAGGPCLLLAPMEKLAKPGPECQQPSVLVGSEWSWCHDSVWLRVSRTTS